MKNAIEHLGHESVSVRLGGAYELFHLAEDAKKLRQTVLDILCDHIRQTTGERKYRRTYKSKPSEEIQSLLTLLFVQEYEVFKGLRVDLQGSFLLYRGALKNRFVHNLIGTKDSDPPLAKDIAKLLDRVGDMLAEDPFIRQMMNERLKATIPSFVDCYRDHLSGGISKTVEGWDARQTSDRIELHIGKDLQFIRINGTIVGGLVGLTIYSVSHVFF